MWLVNNWKEYGWSIIERNMVGQYYYIDQAHPSTVILTQNVPLPLLTNGYFSIKRSVSRDISVQDVQAVGTV
jgi:hypothetical protein